MCIPIQLAPTDTLMHAYCKWTHRSEAEEKPCFTPTDAFSDVCLYGWVCETHRSTLQRLQAAAGKIPTHTLTHTSGPLNIQMWLCGRLWTSVHQKQGERRAWSELNQLMEYRFPQPASAWGHTNTHTYSRALALYTHAHSVCWFVLKEDGWSSTETQLCVLFVWVISHFHGTINTFWNHLNYEKLLFHLPETIYKRWT